VSCHDPHVTAKGARSQLREVQHAPFAKSDCVACHVARGSSTLKTKGAELCLGCHEDMKAQVSRANRHAPLDSPRECLSCHGPHTAAAKPMLLMKTEDLCVSCHGKQMLQGSVRHKALEQGCTSCHDPHSSDTDHMLKKPVEQLCTTCHADLSKHFHKTTSTKPDPQTGKPLTCTGCHSPHASDFPSLLRGDPKRDLCIRCHDTAMFPDSTR
jgi:predicted CXXCH cytochrome family protein